MTRATAPSPSERPWYKNAPLLAGALLMVLGLGNWITGEVRTAEHETVAVRPAEPSSGSEVEQPVPSQEELELARVRMDFYHVVASGGRLLTAAGLVLTSFGLARHLHGQGRRN